jgi:amino acid adenylation domain-containing protein
VLFLFQNMPQEDLELPELKVEAIGTGLATDNSEWVVTDLVLSVQEDGNGLTLGCKYDPDLYDAETVRRLLEHLSILVDSITRDPDKEISRLPMLSDTESRQLLSEWDLSHVERSPRCVHELFEEQAARYPEAAAISINNRVVSYCELSERSDQIAQGLSELGIARGQVVAVMLDDGALQVASLLGVLKAGAHFVCIDPHYPLARLQQILAELAPNCVVASGARVHLLRKALAAAAVKDSWPVVLLEGQIARANGDEASSLRDGTRWFQRRVAAPITKATTPDDIAYIVYTSGSTGRPKGIMQSHDGLCQYVEFQARRFDIHLSKRVAQWASLSYDAAYAEIFGALCAGATLCMTDTTVRSEPRAMLEWLREERVNVLITVPSFARHLFQLIKAEAGATHPLPDLECLLLAGEALPVAFAREWIERFQGPPGLFNLYGPTESILATCYEVTTVSAEQPSVPVGGAMDGRHILILDRDQQLAPVGGRGEIYIRSPYLTKGYLGQPKETARVFIQNPLHMDHPDPVYRTGDLGRWLPGGVIELMGRADNQIKIRGMRVELEEIEAAATRHPGVAECAVVVREQTGAEPRLIACVVPANHLAASELRTFLKEQLPAHMVPSDFAFLPALPRTRSGKVDRQSLAVAEVYTLSDDRDFVAPRTNFEIAVAGIWKELLGVERVGIHDNFFDLGGHSLSATQVVNQLRNLFSVEIELRDFFESPTVAELALLVEAQQQTDEPAELTNLAGLLEMVKQLPDSEVEKLLLQQDAAPEQRHLD